MSDAILRFARYAYPPNELGLCGPDRSGELAEAIAQGVGHRDLVSVAQAFSGAWPYLELLGDHIGGGEALSDAAVDAYWLADPQGRRVSVSALGDSLRERFGSRLGWPGLRDSINDGGWPSHAYHVFCVYPWVGLIRSGSTDPGLHVINRCRIRSGIVLELSGNVAVVESDHLTWDGTRLRSGDTVTERAEIHPGSGVMTGSRVSLHWGWVCEPISENQKRWLDESQSHHLALANSAGAIHSLS